MPTFNIEDHLIIPFGYTQKKEIYRVHLLSVGPGGVWLQSQTPAVHIQRNTKQPLTFQQFNSTFGVKHFPAETSIQESWSAANTIIQGLIPSPTVHENQFLEAYFDYIWEDYNYTADAFEENEDKIPQFALFNALLPIPQAWFYVHDPLKQTPWSNISFPVDCYRVDFAFWDGLQLYAIEIDGNKPNFAYHIERDRRLRSSGIEVIHILNSELAKHKWVAVQQLLPIKLKRHWAETDVDPPTTNPLTSVFYGHD
ncbi:MAG TPA: hypothetical protein VEG60_08285 [Candidatus Binatia bacterium]|nr:hypothetical protein [Candidatus Binatia bacterium]